MVKFTEPVYLNSYDVNSSLPLNRLKKTVFELKFNRKKFLAENYNSRCQSTCSSRSNQQFNSIPKFSILTNFTNFHITLFVYDGLLKFVCFYSILWLNSKYKHLFKYDLFKLKSLNKNTVYNDKDNYNAKSEELNNFHLDGILVNSTKEITFSINNFNPIDVSLIKKKTSQKGSSLKLIF